MRKSEELFLPRSFALHFFCYEQTFNDSLIKLQNKPLDSESGASNLITKYIFGQIKKTRNKFNSMAVNRSRPCPN